jgi:excisionase family DNA binding protein
MAGMFYSLQEAAQKLNMSEEEIQKLVEQRKLREFRDGTNVLFKVSEVESLMADMGLSAAEAPAEEGEELILEPSEPQAIEPETAAEEELSLEPEAAEPQTVEPEAVEPEVVEPEAIAPEAVEPESVEQEAPGEEEVSLEAAGSTAGPEELKLDAEKTGGLGGDTDQVELSLDDSLALLSDQEDLGQEPAAEDSFSLLDTDQAKKPPEEAKADEKEETEVSFSLDEQEKDSGLTNADTAITREGISVLDESDREFKLSEDTAAETRAMQETSSLEQIESDINLDDTLGSGSGLLDLSLQADDTSLGGILDEIYTPAGDEGAAAVPEPAAASAADVAAEAESIIAQGSMAGAPAVMVQGYIEPEPDSSSNIFGSLLLIPLLVVVYTLLITIAGQFGILSTLIPKGMTIMYILAGVGVFGLVIAMYGYMQGTPSKPKEPKPKKEKAPKVKKEKPKKEKKVKVKKEKEKKEK